MTDYTCSDVVPYNGSHQSVTLKLGDDDTINDPGSTKKRLRGPGIARVTRYSDGGLGIEWMQEERKTMIIDKCPICEAGIQSHTILTREYEGLTLALTASGNLVIENEGTLSYEDYTGPFSGTEVYCENDHSDEDMAEHLREQSKNV